MQKQNSYRWSIGEAELMEAEVQLARVKDEGSVSEEVWDPVCSMEAECAPC